MVSADPVLPVSCFLSSINAIAPSGAIPCACFVSDLSHLFTSSELRDTATTPGVPAVRRSTSPIKHFVLEVIGLFHSHTSSYDHTITTSPISTATSSNTTATATTSSSPLSPSPVSQQNVAVTHSAHQPSSAITVPHSDNDPNATDSPGTFIPSFISHPATRHAAYSLAFVLLGLSVKYLIIKYFQTDRATSTADYNRRGDDLHNYWQPRSWHERLGRRNVARSHRLKTWWKSQLRRVSWTGGSGSDNEGSEDEQGVIISDAMVDGHANRNDDTRRYVPMTSNEYSRTAMIDEILGFRRVLEFVGELIRPMEAPSSTTMSTMSTAAANQETQSNVLQTSASTFPMHQAPSSIPVQYQQEHQRARRYSRTRLSSSSVEDHPAVPEPPVSPISRPWPSHIAHRQSVTPMELSL